MGGNAIPEVTIEGDGPGNYRVRDENGDLIPFVEKVVFEATAGFGMARLTIVRRAKIDVKAPAEITEVSAG
jgi:hypothetical protein